MKPTPGVVEGGHLVPRAPPPVLAFTAVGPIVGLLLLLLDRVWASRVITSRFSKAMSIVVGMPSPLRTILLNRLWERLLTEGAGRHMGQSQIRLARHFRLPSHQLLRLLISFGSNLQVAILLKYRNCPLHISHPTTSTSALVEKKTLSLLRFNLFNLPTGNTDTSTLCSMSL